MNKNTISLQIYRRKKITRLGRNVPDQGSELSQGCAGVNQDSAAQTLNRGNHC